MLPPQLSNFPPLAERIITRCRAASLLRLLEESLVRRFATCLILLLLSTRPAAAAHLLPRPFELDRVNRGLHGKVVDHTNNHGRNAAIWSQALCERRDLYVYLPPCFDPAKQYPVIFWLHGFAQDENSFVNEIVEPIDKAIWCGKLPACHRRRAGRQSAWHRRPLQRR